MKRFSIIITTHNRKEFFKKAFISAINQNFDDYEIVVVNNGDEKVEDIIEEYKNNREVKLINYNEKRSCATASNIGIKNSDGEWICFLDDDDEILPYYLEEINKNITPEDNWILITGILKKGNKEKILFDKELLKIKSIEQIIKKLFKPNHFYRWANIIKKEMYEKLGFFDENFLRMEDSDFCLRMVLNGYKFKLIPRPLYIYHWITAPDIKKYKGHIEASLKLYKKYEDLIKHDKEIQASLYYNIGWLYLQIKEDKQAFQYFKKSFFSKPSVKSFIRMLETLFELNKKYNFEKFLHKITGKYYWLDE